MATAYLLAGDLGQAEAYLDLAAPRSEPGGAGAASLHPDVDNDRSLIAMNRGRLDGALRLTDVVMRARPEHRPAPWNRALVLGRFDLGLAGVAVFDRIKALGEPGWSVEAGQRAAHLRGPIEERRQRWLEVLKAGHEAYYAFVAITLRMGKRSFNQQKRPARRGWPSMSSRPR